MALSWGSLSLVVVFVGESVGYALERMSQNRRVEVTSSFPQGGSEYGGYPGRIQPPPHDPADVPFEQLQIAYAVDPDDYVTPDTEAAALERLLKEGRDQL